jgi:large repetitive protein
MRTAASGLLRAAAVSLVAIAMGPAALALAEPPTLTIESPVNGSIGNNQTPSISGSTNDPFDEVTVKIYAGSGVGGSPAQTLTAPLPLGGAWSTPAAESLGDGVYTAQASQISVGEEGTSEPVTFAIDTSSPTVTLNPPPTPSNNTAPSFSGFASDTTPVTVQIYAGPTIKGTPVSSATATHTGGDWSSSEASPALSSGQYTAVATQESSLGNPPGTSSAVTFTVDTSSPTVTLDQPKSPSNNTTPSFTGSASDTTPVAIQIYSGATAEGTPVATAAATGTGGSWSSGKASPSLVSGQYTAVATQESSLGNPPGESAPVSFTVDTSSPTVTLSQPPPLSNDTTPSFTGTASGTTTVTVQIYAGATAEGTVVSTATASGTGGAWSSGQASPGLSSGQYTAIAVQQSPLGNPAGLSAPVTFGVETAAPTVTLSSPALRSNNTAPSFTGTASDTTTVTVHIYAGSTAKGTVVSSATAAGTGGAWSSSKASPSLVSGQYTAVATQESSLGNPTGESAPATFIVDTTSPTVTLSQPKSPSNNTAPSFAGTATDTTSVTVHVYAGSTAKGTVVSSATAAGTGGAWTSSKASPSLVSGQYTAVATQESSLGNPDGESAPVTFTVDTSSPTVTLSQPTSPSNNTTPSFTGNASDPTEPVTVQIFAGATAKGTVVSTAKATATGGAWTSSKASPALPSGQYTAIATQPSSLGNPAGTSSSRTFTVDTTSPTVTLSQPKSPSNNRTPSFSGTASDSTPVIVRVYDATNSEVASVSAAPNGEHKWTSANLGQALSTGKHTYTAIASQQSSLGNPTGESARVTFTVDTTAPVVTIDPPISHSNNTKPSFSGTATDTTKVTVTVHLGTKVTGTVVGTATATPSGGSWVSGHVSLPEGKNTFTAVATQPSSLGNPAGTSGPVSFTVDTAAPTVTMNVPPARTNSTTPSFAGTTDEASAVVVYVYDESNKEVATATAPATIGSWTSGVTSVALPDGQYTAIAKQESLFGNHVGESETSPFTVDTVLPHVTLSYPAGGSSTGSSSQVVSGTAGTEPGDLPGVTVQLFSGAEIEQGQTPLQSIHVTAKSAWSATIAGLSAGTYSVRAEQSDEGGNLGLSSPTTFSVLGPAAAGVSGGPTASFSWIPAAPHAGERVSLLSSSTDLASPITAYAWDLAGNGAFAAGGPVNSASFSTPGKHVVQLRVTDANGHASVAAETIDVGPASLPLMQPFPTVRITATRRRGGTRLKLLSVRTSAGARVTVTCRGRGCPIKSQSRLAAAGTVGAAPIEFRRFERSLRAGVVLEIRVSRAGQIGKYTRFSIRRGRLPARADACLGPTSVNPIPCPAS